MIVADTHTFVWWAHRREKLAAAAHETLRSADLIVISTITCWEISMLVAKRRFEFDVDARTWIVRALVSTGIEAFPLPVEAAVRAGELEELRDPADQMIVATALYLHAPLVTKDERITRSGIVETIW